ncbi:MAG: methyltransferase domain-containing protein [Bacteroidales bacterium]
MLETLERINRRPQPWSAYTASDLWTDEHTSAQMLAYHLNGDIDVSSRNAAFIARSVAWITSEFGIGPGRRIADFGCGPGLNATPLAQTGAEVTGIDFSVRSLEHARGVAEREGLTIRYVHQNYLEFESDDRFDLVMMIMCDFCALSPVQRRGMLDRFRRILTPDGSVLLDVYSLSRFAGLEESTGYALGLHNGFWSARPYYGFYNTFLYPKEKVALDKFTLVEDGRTREVFNWLQHFSPSSLEAEFAEAGFRVRNLFSDVAGSPYEEDSPEFAVVADLA